MRPPRRFHAAAAVVTLATALTAAGVTGGASAATVAAPAVWVHSGSDRAFSSSTPPAGPPRTIDLHAARGETEAAQVLVRGGEALTGVRMTAAALRGPQGATIPAERITVRREYNHPNVLLLNGGNEIPPDGSRSYYDALVENTPVDLAANTTQAYHYSVDVVPGQPPGRYTGAAQVLTSAGSVMVPVSVTVYPVTLPSTTEQTVRINNWTGAAGWDYNGTVNSIPLQYGVQQYDANWWKVIANMARNHAKHRNNVVFADFQALLIPNTTIDDDGTYHFGWETFDRYIQTYVDAGAMRWIYTPHLLEPAAGGTAKLEMLKKVDGKVQRVLVDPGSAEAQAYLDTVFPALKAHLDAKGWTDRFYMSALDEPGRPAQETAANWLYDTYKKYFPKPLTNEAHLSVRHALERSLTTVTPEIDLYDVQQGYYQRFRLTGKDLWFYNCICTQGEYMNRYLSYHLAKTRLTFWALWKSYGVGYLHWGWNFWVNFSNVNVPADTFDGAQTGDNWLVRPNKAAYDVYDSVRSEAQLDGIEDYELLAMLAKRKPAKARAISEELITDLTHYTKSGAAVSAAHQRLLQELVSSSGDEVPAFGDDFSGPDDARWRHSRGTWSVANGVYSQTSTARWDHVSSPAARAYRDVSVDADLRITGVNPNGGNTNWAGLMLRTANATDMDTGYLVALRNNGELFVYRSGVSLGTAQVPGYVPGGWTHLRAVMRGDTLTVYAGGEQVLTVTDGAFTAGAAGLITGGSSVQFDNVRMVPLQ